MVSRSAARAIASRRVTRRLLADVLRLHLPQPAGLGQADRGIDGPGIGHGQRRQHAGQAAREGARAPDAAARASGARRRTIPRLVFTATHRRVSWTALRTVSPTPACARSTQGGPDGHRAQQEILEARVVEVVVAATRFPAWGRRPRAGRPPGRRERSRPATESARLNRGSRDERLPQDRGVHGPGLECAPALDVGQGHLGRAEQVGIDLVEVPAIPLEEVVERRPVVRGTRMTGCGAPASCSASSSARTVRWTTPP